MPLSLNKVILAGVLADKPVVREVEGGRKMVGLSIVTTRHWSDAKNGKPQEGKEWHRVVIIHQPLATFAEAHLATGDEVYIEGELHTEFWRGDTFEWRALTKIILWQDGHQLRRFKDDDQPAPSASQHHPLLDVAREAPLIEIPSGDPLLGHVA